MVQIAQIYTDKDTVFAIRIMRSKMLSVITVQSTPNSTRFSVISILHAVSQTWVSGQAIGQAKVRLRSSCLGLRQSKTQPRL